ncbi:MAG: BolA/IbaG family iron-sulfur metabolism protein [Xanthomonadales bacterium]|nr:BolA/IbaG family iron-sulfur metabolism protein [Xanthomonadales bacterium]
MNAEQIRQLILAALPDAQVRVEGADGVHFEAEVVSAAFTGQRLLARHRMVYAGLGDLMGGAIHALALSTLTPEEQQAAARR